MIRAILGAVIGAAAAAAAFVAFTLLDPAIALEMQRNVPRPLASGLYPTEEVGDDTYAWTGPLAIFYFRDIDRGSAWRCVARVRGLRPPDHTQPQITIAADGVTLAVRTAGPHYEDIDVIVPPRDARGLRLSISSSPTFVPAADPRELGVQLDRLVCDPIDRGWVSPPGKALLTVTLAVAAFGVVFGTAGTALMSTLAPIVFALALAWLVHTGIGSFTAVYLDWLLRLALWIAVPAAAVTSASSTRTSTTARFVIAFSAAVLFLKLAALMHPSKGLVDALFHAHRLEWVLSGRYLFTQPMPGGVQFPYAIALYVTASPLASVIRDHVALLRIVVCVIEALGAGLLYLVVVRSWGDRLAAALAVVCYHLVPLPYAVIGNANLTYAFGHGISLLAFAAVSVCVLRWRHVGALAALLFAAAVAFLSHVAVFPLLAAALVFTGLLYAGSHEVEVRSYGVPVIATCVFAAVLAFALYYAHFPEVYRTLDRVRSTPADNAAGAPPAPPPMPVATRAGRAFTIGVRDLGVSLTLLTCAGFWLRLRKGGDRLNRVLAGWGIAFVLFVGFRVVAPVDPRLQRYADEFIGRVYYATLPAIVILAAWAAASGWRTRGTVRAMTVVLGAAAVVVGIATWASWLR